MKLVKNTIMPTKSDSTLTKPRKRKQVIRYIQSDENSNKRRCLESTTWYSESGKVFSQLNTERCAYDWLQPRPRDFIQGFLLIYTMTSKFDDLSSIDPMVDGIESTEELYKIITPYTADNEVLMSVGNMVDWFVEIGFYYNEKRTKIKCPSFFYDSKNQLEIRQFNKMLDDTIHLLLHKFYIESRDRLYPLFSKYQKREFNLLKFSMKDEILKELYQKTLKQCTESIELNGFKYFEPSTSIVEAVVDGTHSVIYLGWCYRDDPNGDWEEEPNGSLKKYAVVTAYFCCEPVMVLYERIEYQLKLIEKIGIEHYCVHWENHEITFEADMEEEYRSMQEAGKKEEVLPQDQPHPNEALCFEFLPEKGGKNTEATRLFRRIYKDMQDPYWRIFCKLPKINLLFEREKDLIASYLKEFGVSTTLKHYLIYGISLLCGRYPDAIKLHLTHLGAFETYSAVVYDDCDPGIGRLDEMERTLRQQKYEILEKLQDIYQEKGRNININTITLEKLKEWLLKSRKNWKHAIMESYKRKATIAVARIINEEDESEDMDDGNGNKLPKSMCKVRVNDEEFYYKFDDISRGTARYPVSAINEIDQHLFDSFHYLLETRVEPSLASLIEKELQKSKKGCSCFKNKDLKPKSQRKNDHSDEEVKDLSCSKRCDCIRIMGCRAYDEQGFLTRKALYSAFHIFECNQNCRCDPNTCSNRVVQKGFSVPMQLFKTVDKGWGVRALDNIKKGQFIEEYVGELITENIAEQRGLDYDTKFECSYLFDIRQDNNKYSIDSNLYGNVARWFNHSCTPNMVSREVSIETRNLHLSRIAFFAKRNIEAGEELTYNYNYEIKNRLKCHCHTPNCKGWLM
jgi:hypothetical protein